MAIKATLEILGTRMWDMNPDILHELKKTVDSNLLLHAHFDKGENEAGVPYFMSAADGFQEKIYVGNAVRINRWYGDEMDQTDVIVNVVPVEGPILRNGDGCSYGSKEYRDWLMAAADVPNCAGHLIYIDTPGGSAYAKNDFKQAIDYVKSKNQPIIALVDGLCASAGMALASMCDEIYFVNPMDRIGSIGTMCAFYATPDGVEDAVTHERFIEVYGSKSEFKNKEYRDAAVGDYTELQAEVDDLNEQFWNVVKTYRPQVQEEQMHGKVYNCGEVIGTLVDGQGTMQSCIDRILEKAGVQPVVPASRNEGVASVASSDNSMTQTVEVPEVQEKNTGKEPGEETTTETVTEATTEETTTQATEEATEPPTEAPTEAVKQEVKFSFDTLLSSAGSVTSSLGEPMNVATAPSCYTNGGDSKIYTYDGLIVECYVLDGAETICCVTITNANYSTDKGIKIGSSKAEVEAAYGAGEEIGYYTIYPSGNKELDVKYEGDVVTELMFYTAV